VLRHYEHLLLRISGLHRSVVIFPSDDVECFDILWSRTKASLSGGQSQKADRQAGQQSACRGPT
jgi:hypothetical protein